MSKPALTAGTESECRTPKQSCTASGADFCEINPRTGKVSKRALEFSS
jgi:hypothetical protein